MELIGFNWDNELKLHRILMFKSEKYLNNKSTRDNKSVTPFHGQVLKRIQILAILSQQDEKAKCNWTWL